MAFDFCFDKKLFLDATCRCCSRFFSENVKFHKIFEEKLKSAEDDALPKNDQNEVFYEPSDDINEILEDLVIWKLDILPGDGLPQQLCVECFERFKQVRSFREECLDSQRILKSYFLDYEHVSDDGKLSPKSDSVKVDSELVTDSALNKHVVRSSPKYNQELGSPFSSPRLRLSPRFAELGSCMDTTSSIGTPPPLFEEIKTEPIDMETMEVIKPESELAFQEPHKTDYQLIRSPHNSSDDDDEQSSTPTSDDEQGHYSSSSEDEEVFKIKQTKAKKFPPRLKCKICDELCLNRPDLKVHMLRHHPQDKPFECDICASTFKSTFMLQQHKLKHNRPDTTQCEECSKYFRSQLHLQRHVKNFHLKSTYTCHICNQQFENYTQMRFQYHVRQHGEKRFQCTFCSKAFHQKIHLANHERSHTKEQPYSCKLCGKAYRTQSACQEHMLTHKDPTPYKCKHCPKAFPQRTTLRTHIQRLHGLEKDTKSGNQPHFDSHNFF